jgi:hypothetical protein
MFTRDDRRYRSYKKLVTWCPSIRKLIQSVVENSELSYVYSKVRLPYPLVTMLIDSIASWIKVLMERGRMIQRASKSLLPHGWCNKTHHQTPSFKGKTRYAADSTTMQLDGSYALLITTGMILCKFYSHQNVLLNNVIASNKASGTIILIIVWQLILGLLLYIRTRHMIRWTLQKVCFKGHYFWRYVSHRWMIIYWDRL